MLTVPNKRETSLYTAAMNIARFPASTMISGRGERPRWQSCRARTMLALFIAIALGSASGATAHCPTTGRNHTLLGYNCSLLTDSGGLSIYWTVGPASAQPTNLCTAGGSGPPSLAGNQVMHMAVNAPSTDGWVGMGFASRTGKMQYSDVALGLVNIVGHHVVGAWPVGSNYFAIKDDKPLMGTTWMHGAVLSSDPQLGLTLCFSRLPQDPAATYSSDLDLNNAINVNFAYLPHTFNLTAHLLRNAGGVLINLLTGDIEQDVSYNTSYWVKMHGILMTVAWAFLLPLGALLARHKWVFNGFAIDGTQVWFYLHLFCQVCGMALFIAGYVIAWTVPLATSHGWSGEVGVGLEPIGMTHRVMGTIVMGLASLNVIAGFVRPAPDNKKLRPAFNFLHHWNGRLSIAVSWATIYLGCYMAHMKPAFRYSWVSWFVPNIVLMGTLVAVDLGLTLLRCAMPSPDDGDSSSGSSGSSGGSSDGGEKPTETINPTVTVTGV